jgi:site-specific recombinase XerD
MPSPEPSGKSVSSWIAPEGLPAAAAERVRSWWERAERVYPPNTQKAWRSDWAVFLGFCGSKAECPLPASPETVAAFVVHCKELGRKPATVRRYLSTIAVAHRVAKLLNPCSDEAVQLELKGLTNVLNSRQRQARALGWAEIKTFLETAGESLPATRERALLCVAYDTMARRAELVALNVEDFESLSEILCARHNMREDHGYANQEENRSRTGGSPRPAAGDAC